MIQFPVMTEHVVKKSKPLEIITDLEKIKNAAVEKQPENEDFIVFLKRQNSAATDSAVHRLNKAISEQIDCKQCGNCCNSLLIHITDEEAVNLARHLNITPGEVAERYIEESPGGQKLMSAVPCHFLKNKMCTVYEQRFSDCREFPHLHKPDFTRRVSGIFMYYEMCPIIFNVMEQLKTELNF